MGTKIPFQDVPLNATDMYLMETMLGHRLRGWPNIVSTPDP